MNNHSLIRLVYLLEKDPQGDYDGLLKKPVNSLTLDPEDYGMRASDVKGPSVSRVLRGPIAPTFWDPSNFRLYSRGGIPNPTV